MSTKKLRYRPTVQTLENRRCLAGALGIGATPNEPALDGLSSEETTNDPSTAVPLHRVINNTIYSGDVTGDGTDEIAIIAKPAELNEPEALTIPISVQAINDAPVDDDGGLWNGLTIGDGTLTISDTSNNIAADAGGESDGGTGNDVLLGGAGNDLITGAGAGGGPHVRVFDGLSSAGVFPSENHDELSSNFQVSDVDASTDAADAFFTDFDNRFARDGANKIIAVLIG